MDSKKKLVFAVASDNMQVNTPRWFYKCQLENYQGHKCILIVVASTQVGKRGLKHSLRIMFSKGISAAVFQVQRYINYQGFRRQISE